MYDGSTLTSDRRPRNAPCLFSTSHTLLLRMRLYVHYAHAQVLHMAGFKFNFFPDSDDVVSINTPTTSATSTDSHDHSSSLPASSSPSSATSPCVSVSHYSKTLSGTHGYCKLKEVLVEPYHEKLLNLLYPVIFSLKQTYTSTISLSPSPPHTSSHLHSHTPPTVTLYHVTSEQLQSLLDEERSIDFTEQILNVKSDTRSSVLSKLRSELGPLVGVADFAHSDLIPGIYKGGMKMWECTHDLIDYLSIDSTVSLYGSRVLELVWDYQGSLL